jgi:A/G-specific adenine glycosylase
MLQQTQVGTVLPYYERFLGRFPDLASLAEAPVDDVLQHWAGLGYYSRARNLHKAAQTIQTQYAGVFPADPLMLATLPGIGPSTAAAIAVFAFGVRAAILDGNVKRVLSRYLGIEGLPNQTATVKTLWQAANALLPESDVKAYTQGLMDLGSSLCRRSKPLCGQCPQQSSCYASQTSRTHELPTRKPSKARPERQSWLGILIHANQVLLQRRPDNGIWGGLWVPPLFDSPTQASDWLQSMQAEQHAALPFITHELTHFRWHLQGLVGCAHKAEPAPDQFSWVTAAELSVYALPAPMKPLLEQALSHPQGPFF